MTVLPLKPGSSAVVPAPPDRAEDRLMNAEEISRDLLGGHWSPASVRRRVPGKITLGHSTVVWWLSDVVAWVESMRNHRQDTTE